MDRQGDHTLRRGMTMVELLLAIAITAMVGAAIAAMLGAISSGVGDRRDMRAFMIHANAAQARLNAYITPSHCILSQEGGDLILWFDDQRKSDTVYASEVRWLLYDDEEGVIEALRVEFPSHMRAAQRQMADREYPANTNWYDVLAYYENRNWVYGYDLLDGLQNVSITLDRSDVLESRQVSYRLTLAGETSSREMMIASVMQKHRRPAD